VVLILTYVAFSLPVSVVILRGFFAGVPRELEEAARIDGCSHLRLFWHVMLPLAKPALAVVAIFNAVTLWNEFVFALVLIDRPGLETVPLGIFRFSEQYSYNIPLSCAGMAVAAVPMLLVYFIAQKHIIRGLTAGALKG
jgi:raffinose/stachyose/melibiose transport system permease protein